MNCEKLWYHVDGIQYFDRYTRADIEIFILELISFKVEQVQLKEIQCTAILYRYILYINVINRQVFLFRAWVCRRLFERSDLVWVYYITTNLSGDLFGIGSKTKWVLMKEVRLSYRWICMHTETLTLTNKVKFFVYVPCIGKTFCGYFFAVF